MPSLEDDRTAAVHWNTPILLLSEIKCKDSYRLPLLVLKVTSFIF